MTKGDGTIRGQGDGDDEIERLAERWPRALIEAGSAESLARRWVTSRRAAIAAGQPPFAYHPLTPLLASTLSELRRSRRLVRGLEAAEESLTAQALGVRHLASPHQPAARRVSRLLLVSTDGSTRFYRNIERLIRQSGETLEVVVLVCDEQELGTAVFGAENRVRAVLVDHKEAVTRVLAGLVEFDSESRVDG